MPTDEDTIRALITSISDPVFVIIPEREIDEEDSVRIFQALEDVLTKIEEKVGSEFDVMIESSVYFGGYREMSDLAQEQKDDVEDEIERARIPEGTLNDGDEEQPA